MSYSFDLRRPSKDAMKIAVLDKMTEVVAQQPCHEADLQLAVDAAVGAVNLVNDAAAEGKDVFVRMSGSLMGKWAGNVVESIHSVNLSITVSLAERV